MGLPLWLRWCQICDNLPAMQETPVSLETLWRREQQPTPVFLPEESHGQRSLVGYNPWGHKELDMTEWLSTQIHTSEIWDRWMFPDLGIKSYLIPELNSKSQSEILFKLVLEKADEPEIKLPISTGSWKKQESSRKNLYLLYWLCQSLWLCGSQSTVENSERDGNTRPCDVPLEKAVCRSGSNS